MKILPIDFLLLVLHKKKKFFLEMHQKEKQMSDIWSGFNNPLSRQD